MHKNPLIGIPNIGAVLAEKLWLVGIQSKEDLIALGSESALIRISALEQSGVCINMLYALEGAIMGIRWHHLDMLRKQELLAFYRSNF